MKLRPVPASGAGFLLEDAAAAGGLTCFKFRFLRGPLYAPCPVCHGARYNSATLDVLWNGLSIADVPNLTVEAACAAFADEPQVLRDIGLGYLRLGQPATELSGGEAQRT